MSEIKKINSYLADTIFHRWEENEAEKGLFWYKDKDVYVGIDNTTDDFWIEEFDTLEECLNWLNREGD